MTSAFGNDRQHQPRHVKFKQAMPANGKRHKPGNIGRGFCTLPNCCWSWNARIGRSFCTLLSLYRARMPASPLVSTQRSANVGCFLFASPLATIQWSSNVKRGLPASTLACIQWSTDIRHSLAESPFACRKGLADDSRGMLIYYRLCRPMPYDFSQTSTHAREMCISSK